VLSAYAQRVRAHAHPVSWPWTEVGVVAALGTIFLPVAVFRFVDGDEGAYLAAAALTVDGAVPYHDFLYTQMPLLPYVYGAWTTIWGEDWYAARLLSVILAVALGALLFRHLTARFGRGLALLGLALYASNSLVLVWFVTVKTYALTALLVFVAYLLVERGRIGLGRWAFAGALLALAVDTRLLLAGAVPAFAWAALRSSERWRSLAALGGGFLAGLVPSLLLFVNDPGRFLFGNLWYHGSRSSGGLVGDFKQKAEVVASLLGIGTEARPHPQFLLLALAAVVAAISIWLLERRVPFPLVIAASLLLVSLAPTPTYAQYACVAVPFLVVVAVELASRLSARIDSQNLRVARAALVAALGLFAVLGAADVGRFMIRSPDNRIGAVQDVARVVDANTRAGEEVVAGWPGYLFGSGANPVSGLENDFAPHEAAVLSAEKAHRYRMATVDDVEAMIRAHRTRVVVANVWENNLPPFPNFEGTAKANGYRLLAEVNGVKVFIARG
jgi:hypothetical protein